MAKAALLNPRAANGLGVLGFRVVGRGFGGLGFIRFRVYAFLGRGFEVLGFRV